MTMAEKRDPDTLAERLDAVVPPGRSDAPPLHNDPLIDAAARLASSPRPRLAPGVRAQIQAQVLAAHQRQAARTRPVQRRRAPALRWAAGARLAAVFVLVVGLTPAVAASAPGDALYPVKRGIERIELALATSPQALASVHMDHAERRAQEALALLERDRLDSDLVTGALDEMAAAAAAVGEQEPFRSQVEARTVQITALLDYAVGRAERSARFPQEAVSPLAVALATSQASGALLLPPTRTATPTSTPTAVPTATPEPPTQTPTEAVSPEPAAMGVGAPEAFPLALVITGVIEEVGAHSVVIGGEEYALPGPVEPGTFKVGETVALTVLLGEEANTVIGSGPAAPVATPSNDAHPVASAIAEAVGVPVSEVLGLHEERNLGYGELARAYLVADELGLGVTEVLAARAQGARWDEILVANGAAPATFSNGRVMSASGAASGIAVPEGQKPTGQGQGNQGNPGQGNQNNPGQGNQGNPGQGTQDNQGNRDNQGQGNQGNEGQGNQGQGNQANPGQGNPRGGPPPGGPPGQNR
ncbi:MAG: hypothetical protein Kow00120_22540 [Anaerolineae bacterium]